MASMLLKVCTSEVAALVGLDDDRVGLVVVVGGDRGLGPGGGVAALDGAVADDVAALVDAEAGDDDAAAVGAGGGRDRRIDGDDDADELGARQQAALVELAALPQAGHALLHDLALELLAADRRVAVAALHLGQEGGARKLALSAVRERLMAVAWSSMMRFKSGMAAAWW